MNAIKMACLSVGIVTLAGCATPMPAGGLYWDGSLPVNATGEVGTKTGKACMTSVLSLIATGDASIAAAKASGGITKVSAVDFEAKNFFGLFGRHCTVVSGD